MVVDFVEYMATATNAIKRGTEFNHKQKALDSRIAEYRKKQISGVEDANEKAAIDEATDKQRKLLVESIQESCARGFEEMLEILVESTTNHHLWLNATAIAGDFCNGFVPALKEASDAGGMEVIAVSIMMQTSLFFYPLFIDDTLKMFLGADKVHGNQHLCTEDHVHQVHDRFRERFDPRADSWHSSALCPGGARPDFHADGQNLATGGVHEDSAGALWRSLINE
jgi:vacuolar-type H+-ATPase subunit H